MRRQNRVLASRAVLILPWTLPQVTVHLVQRVSMSAQPLPPLTRECVVSRVGQQQMQPWWVRLWPNLRTQEKLRLQAFAGKEHTVTLRTLLTLACAVLNVLRYPLRGSLHREATLCQR